MYNPTVLQVEMTLLSDTIFGSGFSIPGGEDISVCIEENGYPYMKGSSLKGLLRESLYHLLRWQGKTETEVTEALRELLGEEGWKQGSTERRLRFTDLTLRNPQKKAPEDCMRMRVFTALEDQVVKTDTLRLANCVCKGLIFTGEISCQEADAELLKQALSNIKWVGTLRSRGLGLVQIRGSELKKKTAENSISSANCIRYKIRTELPLMITDLKKSSGSEKKKGNNYETKNYIPGSSIRGLVLGRLAKEDPDWFEAHKKELLSEQLRFLNAYPMGNDLSPIPSIRGFYETKDESGKIKSIVKNGKLYEANEETQAMKRAKIGSYCALKGNTIQYWSPKTDGTMRLQRQDKNPFQVHYLSKGQRFEGYIWMEDPSLAEKVSQVLSGEIWLGADQYEGFGKCTVLEKEQVNQPTYLQEYGYTSPEIPQKLYLLAISPLAMLDDCGEICSLQKEKLQELLGVSEVEISHCSTAISEYQGFNRTWGCRTPSHVMYDAGSLFQLTCKEPPALEKLQALQKNGLGIRTTEGFGQILFLRTDLYEGIQKKEKIESEKEPKQSQKVEQRRAHYQWIMERADEIRKYGLSSSQIGVIQALCEKAIMQKGNTESLDAHLDKNKNDRGAAYAKKYEKINQFIQKHLESFSEKEKVQGLKQLCELFDFSRKEGK